MCLCRNYYFFVKWRVRFLDPSTKFTESLKALSIASDDVSCDDVSSDASRWTEMTHVSSSGDSETQGLQDRCRARLKWKRSWHLICVKRQWQGGTEANRLARQTAVQVVNGLTWYFFSLVALINTSCIAFMTIIHKFKIE